MRNFLRFFFIRGAVWGMVVGTFCISGIGLQRAWGAAREYPNKPITMIVPYAPGGTVDVQVRGLVPFLQKTLDVPIVIDNVEGGGGIIGFTRAYRAKPDGYTLLGWIFMSALLNEHLGKVEYKTLGFTPIVTISDQTNAFAVNPQVYQTLPQFLEAAKSKTLNIGVSAHGSVSHLNAALICDGFKLKVRYVPFGGGAQVVNALVGKHVDAASVSALSASGLTSSGTLKVLFIAADKRSILFPEFPTAKELGYDLKEAPGIIGIAAPPGLPQPIVKTLEEACLKTMADPEFVTRAKKARIELLNLNAVGYKVRVAGGADIVEKYKDFLKKM